MRDDKQLTEMESNVTTGRERRNKYNSVKFTPKISQKRIYFHITDKQLQNTDIRLLIFLEDLLTCTQHNQLLTHSLTYLACQDDLKERQKPMK